MRESKVEQYLKLRTKEEGGHCLKIRFIARIGCPDRLVLLKDRHFLAELKATKKKARRSQSTIHALLRQAGFEVYVLDNFTDIDEVLTCKRVI